MGIEANYNSAPTVLTTDEYAKSQSATQPVDNDLGRSAFLTLFTAQLQNQNPLDPMKNEAFVSQLAQFSSLESMQNVDNSVKAMSEGMQSDRILLGTNLLGTKVNVVGGGFELSGAGGVKGYTTLAENEDLLTFSVENSNGEKVFEQDIENSTAGRLNFQWNGLNNQDVRQPVGNYKFILSKYEDGEKISLPVNTDQIIQSVSWNETQNEMQVEIQDGRILSMSDLERFAN
jgi:flagellar basal-body rod modification protein FlgD